MIYNYNNLANAIVLQAVKDYRKALNYPNNRSAVYECRSIERFFLSGWFSVLTNIDPKLTYPSSYVHANSY